MEHFNCMTALAVRRPQLIIVNYNHLRHVMTPVGVEPTYNNYSNNYNNTNITMIIINPISMTKLLLTIITIKTRCQVHTAPGHVNKMCMGSLVALLLRKSQWHVIKLTQTRVAQ